MHSELLERCRAARSEISVPDFPWGNISAAAQTRKPAKVRRAFATVAVAVLSLAAAAAAAEIAVHEHIRFTPHGGMVISADKTQSRTIRGDAEIREAAEHLDFAAVLPTGLPAGSRPVQLYTAGSSIMAITYDVPQGHRLWIFLANPDAMGPAAASRAARAAHKHRHFITERWTVRGEDVIAVGDGLPMSQLRAIRAAMNGSRVH